MCDGFCMEMSVRHFLKHLYHQDFKYLEIFTDILQYEGSACRGHSCTTAVTDCDKHKLCDTLCTLREASILPHFKSIHASCPCAVTLCRRMQSTNKSHEPDREWMGIDWTRHSGGVCAWSCCWRIQGGRWRWDGVDPFSLTFLISCSQISFLNPVNPLCIYVSKRNSSRVWLTVYKKISFWSYTNFKDFH